MGSPRISEKLLEELRDVEPSTDGVMDYHPCRVTLRSGATLDRVYVVEEEPYLRAWGIRPEDDPAKSSVDLAEVERIEESPLRLPPPLANKIYAAGESGMGYTVFTLVLADGRSLPYTTGNAVDFPLLPAGIRMADVVDALPHDGRETFRDRLPREEESTADYYWCTYRMSPQPE